MIITREIDKPLSITNPVVTIGSFDGVHNAHVQIIKRINEIAKSINGKSVIITFHPHPRIILNPEDLNFKLLTSTDEKAELIERLGVDHLIIIPFSKKFSNIEAEEFIDHILIKLINSKKIVIGYNHKFGKDRKGDINFLSQKGLLNNFEVESISKQEIDKINISSTEIRKLLSSGNISDATKLLGHPYFFEGKVVKGKQIGNKINFPTANIELENKYKLIPKEGVYAINIKVKNKTYRGMLHIGQKPTILDFTSSIEANIFDFNENIYGEYIKVSIIDHIRDNHKFDNLNRLKEQLYLDKAKAISILEN